MSQSAPHRHFADSQVAAPYFSSVDPNVLIKYADRPRRQAFRVNWGLLTGIIAIALAAVFGPRAYRIGMDRYRAAYAEATHAGEKPGTHHGKGLMPALSPHSQRVLRLQSRVRALFERGRIADAYGPAEELVRIEPHSYQHQRWMALCALEIGDQATAASACRAALRINRNDEWARRGLGESLCRLGRVREGRQHLQAVAANAPAAPASNAADAAPGRSASKS